MATEGKKLMEEIYDQFLVCKICFESYKNPKTLNCLHVFCCECLEKHSESELERSSYRYMIYVRTISCPICRKKTDVPTGGIRRLPDNFLVSNLTEIVDRRRPSHKLLCQICQYSSANQATSKCLECAKLLCKRCVQTHKKTNVTQNHSLFDVEVEKDVMCKVHPDESVRFYCEPCEMCICVLCTFQEHKGHDVSSFTDGMRKYGRVLQELIEACKGRITIVKTHIDLINKCENAIKIAEDNIRDTTISMISAIRTNERKLMSEVQTAFGENTTEFIDSKQGLQETLDNLLSTCNLTDIIIKDNSLELLLLKKDIQTKMQVILEADIPPPPEDVDKPFKFVPGSVKFGRLCNEDEDELDDDAENGNEKDENNKQTVIPKCTTEVQTEHTQGIDAETTMGKLAVDYENEAECQTDSVQRKHESSMTITAVMANRGTMPCSVYSKEMFTMTEASKVITKKCQTENLYGISKYTETVPPEVVHHHTNTPVLDLCSRGTCTFTVKLKDEKSDTSDLRSFRSESVNTNRIQSQEQGCLTDAKETSSKQVSTELETADKLTNTTKSVICNQGTMTEIYSTPDQTISSAGQLKQPQSIETQVDYSQLHIMRNQCSQTLPQINQKTPEEKNLVHRSVGADRTLMKNRFTMTNIPVKHSYTNTDQESVNESQREKVVLVDKNESTVHVPTMESSTTTNHGVKISDRGIATNNIIYTDSATTTDSPSISDSSTQNDKVDYRDTATSTPILHTSDQCVHTEIPTTDKSIGTETKKKITREASCLAHPTTLSRGTCVPRTKLCDTGNLTYQIDTTDASVGDFSTILTDGCTMTQLKYFKETGTVMDRPFTNASATNTVPTEMHEKDVNTVTMPMSDTGTMTTSIKLRDSSTSVSIPFVKSRATCTERVFTKNSACNTFTNTRDVCIGEFTHKLDDKSTGNDYVSMTDAHVCTDIADVVDAATQMQITAMNTVGTCTPIQSLVSNGTNTPIVVLTNKQTMFSPQTVEQGLNTDNRKLVTSGTMTSKAKTVSRGISPISIPGLTRERGTSVSIPSRSTGTTTDITQKRDATCEPVPVISIDVDTMTVILNSDKSVSTHPVVTKSKSTATLQRKMIDSGVGIGCALTMDKETGTAQIHQIHKNVSTDNMTTADKQTNTSNIASAYRQLVAPRVIMKSKGTSMVPPVTKEVQTLTYSVIIPSGNETESKNDNAINPSYYGSSKQNGVLEMQNIRCEMCKQFTNSNNRHTDSVTHLKNGNAQSNNAVNKISYSHDERKCSDSESKHEDKTGMLSDSFEKSNVIICRPLDDRSSISSERHFEDRGTSPIKINGELQVTTPLARASYKPPVIQSNGRVAAIIENNKMKEKETKESANHHLPQNENFSSSSVQTEKLWASEPNLGGTTFVTIGRKVPSSVIMKIDKETNTAAVHQRHISTETPEDATSTEDKSTSTERTPPIPESDPVGGKINECISKLHSVTKRLQYPTQPVHVSTPHELVGALSPKDGVDNESGTGNEPFQLPKFSAYLSRRRLKSTDSEIITAASDTNGSKRFLARKQKLDIIHLLNPDKDEHDGSVIVPKLQVKAVQRKIIPKLEDMLPIKEGKGSETHEQRQYQKSKSGPCRLLSPHEKTAATEDISSNTQSMDDGTNNVSKSAEDLSSRSAYLRDLTAQLRRRHTSTPQLNDTANEQANVDKSAPQ